MQFEHQNDKGENYALLYPKFEENEELKKVADEVGARNALQFDRKERGYRLYEAKLPDSKEFDVDKVFGKYASAEAKAASQAEQEAVAEKRQTAAKATGTAIDESKIYYAAKGNGDREAFNDLRKETGSQFIYSSRQGGFVHKDGPTEGFERFQTPEAKAAWQAEAGKAAETTRKRRENAAEGIDVMAERANGRVFLADNSQGFMLPSKNQKDARSAQIEAMKGASKEEIAQVFKITEAAKKNLDRKLYGVQLNAAKDRGVEKSDFDKMNSEDRRKAANFKGLDKEEFSKLVSPVASSRSAMRWSNAECSRPARALATCRMVPASRPAQPAASRKKSLSPRARNPLTRRRIRRRVVAWPLRLPQVPRRKASAADNTAERR